MMRRLLFVAFLVLAGPAAAETVACRMTERCAPGKGCAKVALDLRVTLRGTVATIRAPGRPVIKGRAHEGGAGRIIALFNAQGRGEGQFTIGRDGKASWITVEGKEYPSYLGTCGGTS